MANWNTYPLKSRPEDNDDLMVGDSSNSTNKRTLFSSVWNYIVDKLAEATIEKLKTNQKTVIGGINEIFNNSLIARSRLLTLDDNLNEIFDPGVYPTYDLRSGENGAPPDNVEYEGFLLVFRSEPFPIFSDSAITLQIYVPTTEYISGAVGIWYRTGVDNSYNEWAGIYKDA